MLRSQLRKQRTPLSTRVLTNWTPQAVRSALYSLQLGKFDRAAYLFDALVGDDRASAVLSTRINGILGCPLEFEPATEKRDAKRAAKLLEEDFWDICPENQIDALLTYGRGLGVALAELRWQRQNGRLIPSLYVWHPSHLRYEDTLDRWSVLTADGEEVIEPGNGKWALYLPYGINFASARTLLRSLAIPWLAKSYAVSDWARHSEKLAGIIKGKTPPVPDPLQEQEFLRDLDNLGASGIVRVPEGWDVELLSAASESHAAFEQLINWADTAMSIAVLGQNLSTEVSGGSLAAAKAHEMVRQDYKEADSESLSTFLHEQVFVHWTQLNIGNVDVTPWARYDTQPESDAKADADTLSVQATALQTLKALNAGVDMQQLLEKFDIPFDANAPMPQQPPPRPPEMPPPEMPEGEPPTPEPPTQPTPEPPEPLQAAAPLTLASGDDPANAGGFVRGQLYADGVADETGKRATPVFADYVRSVTDAIEQANDYDDLRRRLTLLYSGSDPREFAELMERALILGNMAGRLAVIEDAPEVGGDVGS